jgi:hypothetical protein
MCIIDGSVDCIINPISNAIYNVIYPFFSWLVASIYGVFLFIYNVGVLLNLVLSLITGLFGVIFSTNIYAATVFTIIITGITMVAFLRIYNIFAGTTMFGWKLPKL